MRLVKSWQSKMVHRLRNPHHLFLLVRCRACDFCRPLNGVGRGIGEHYELTFLSEGEQAECASSNAMPGTAWASGTHWEGKQPRPGH
jgi:hypothetical protein